MSKWTGGLVLAIALPVAFLAINPNWPFTNPFVPPWYDPFIYLAFFTHPFEYVALHPDYYPATRVPHIALGAAFYAVFPPLLANFALKLTTTSLALGCFYGTVYMTCGRIPGVVATILLATYPYFLTTMGWDFVDRSVLLFTAASYLAAACGARSNSPGHIGEFVAGLMFALALVVNLFAIALGGSIVLFYLACLHRYGSPTRASVLTRAAAALFGFVVGLAASSIVYRAIGGNTAFVLMAQIAHSLTPTTDPFIMNFLLANRAWVLLYATWLAIPVAVALLSADILAASVVRLVLRKGTGRDVFTALVAAHYLFAVALFCVVTWKLIAVLTMWFYTSFLIVPAFVTLACIIEYQQELAARTKQSALIWSLIAIPLVAIHFHPIGSTVNHLLGFDLNPPHAIATTAIVFGGLVLLLLSFAVHPIAIATIGVAMMAAAYVSMYSTEQLNYAVTAKRADGYAAVLAATDVIRSVNNPRRFLWIDRSERNYYGGLFHAAFIQSRLSTTNRRIGGDQSTKFPALPPHNFQPADPVIILTARADWEQAANQSLKTVGLRLGKTEVHHVSFGQVQFEAVHSILVKATDSPGG